MPNCKKDFAIVKYLRLWKNLMRHIYFLKSISITLNYKSMPMVAEMLQKEFLCDIKIYFYSIKINLYSIK